MRYNIIILFLLLGSFGFGQTLPVVNSTLIPEQISFSLVNDPNSIHEPTLNYPINNVIQTKGDLNRRIFFIHGLGGSGESWLKAAQAVQDATYNSGGFLSRKCESTRIDYNSSVMADLNAAAWDVRGQIQAQGLIDNLNPTFDPDRTRSFIIAHSQGGVVGRALLNVDMLTTPITGEQLRGYGGLVTISSPLQGAMILNNKDLILDMANNACLSLSAGPLLKATSFADYFPPLQDIFHSMALDALSSSCDIIAYNLTPVIFSDKLTPITDHYKVGAPDIATLNSNATDPSINAAYNQLPKVAFYGVEPRENLMWRTFNWATTSPNTEDIWEANDDFDFLNNTVTPLYNSYSANFQNYSDKLAHLEYNKKSFIFGGFILPAWWAKYWKEHKGYEAGKREWRKGVQWFNNANSQWETIIGAREYNTITEDFWTCACRVNHHDTDPTSAIFTVSDPADCEALYGCPAVNHYQVVTYEVTYKPSDGVVLNESAMNLPGATHLPVKVNPKFTNSLNEGSSHMQIRNDEGLKISLKKLLNGAYGTYFATDPQ